MADGAGRRLVAVCGARPQLANGGGASCWPSATAAGGRVRFAAVGDQRGWPHSAGDTRRRRAVVLWSRWWLSAIGGVCWSSAAAVVGRGKWRLEASWWPLAAAIPRRPLATDGLPSVAMNKDNRTVGAKRRASSHPDSVLRSARRAAISSAAVDGSAAGVSPALPGTVEDAAAAPAEPRTSALSGGKSDRPSKELAVGGDGNSPNEDKVASSPTDGTPEIPLPAADEADEAAKGTEASSEGIALPSATTFAGMPIRHWRDVPGWREYDAYQLSLPRSERYSDIECGIYPVLTSPEVSDAEDDSD